MSANKELSTAEKMIAAYSEGASDVEIARVLGLTLRKFYELCEDNEPFAEIVERGRTLAQAWWYEKGRTGLFAEKFNTALYNFNMKNRFGWADKVDTGEKSSSEPVNVDQATAELRATLKRIDKKAPHLLRDLGESTDD